jgi:hypothetical protein
MSNQKSVKHVVRGKSMYAQILGDPVLNFSKDAKEWKIDVVIDEGTAKEFKSMGIADRIKRKDTYLEGQPHITFKQAEFRKSGDPNDPIPVTNILDEKWDDKTMIGNGSDIDVSFVVRDYGAGMKKGVYIRSVRVLKLVPYEKTEFKKLDEDDPFFAEAAAIRQKRETEAAQFEVAFGLRTAESKAEYAGLDLDDDIEDVAV